MTQATPPFGADLRRRLDHYVRPGIPKYMAMRDAIAHAVATGAWPPGARLPTEVEWAAELPLSIGTIQRALRMLAEDGVIVRQQGNGTFVAGRAEHSSMHAPLHCRFVADDGAGYLPVYPEISARYEVAEEGPWTGHLRTPLALCIERILSIGKEFSVYSRFYADPERLPALRDTPVKKLAAENFKEIILRETAQQIGRFRQFLMARKLEPEVCRAIGVRSGTVGQRLLVYAYVGRDSPIYYQELSIPPNDRVLHLAADGRDEGSPLPMVGG